MAARKTAQYGYPRLVKEQQVQSAPFKDPIIKVSITGGVEYNRIEAFWNKQLCETSQSFLKQSPHYNTAAV
ncbi:MAG: hypothetical protein VR68_03330 [Peptococcaceae bacterium BRH_c4a]|nr:MAG: hypothetical protein VR68_03330 [Peptococcaceae bacterium BRH_c4a]